MKDGAMQFNLRGIAAELRERQLTVPVYQRSFAWKPEQVAELWSDLKAAFNDTAPEYFLGTIVLTNQSGGDRHAVIDGQQRLATVSILLAAIRDAYGKRLDSNRSDTVQRDYLSKMDLQTAANIPKLTLNSEDAHFFQTRIIEAGIPPIWDSPDSPDTALT